MKGYYQILAESLTDKYLTEAWSESMPNWMKPRLNATAMYSDRNAGKKSDYGNVKGQGTTWDMADYQKPRGGFRGKNLYQSFIDLGIDLSQTEFIEGEIPTKKSDDRIQPPNIGIWNIPFTGQVYAKGVNDLEKLRSSANMPSELTKYIDYPFKSLPIKALYELSDHFCYIPGNKIVNRDYRQISSDRNELNKWRRSQKGGIANRMPAESTYLKNHEFGDPSKGTPFDYLSYSDVLDLQADKSGYYVVPSSKRYAKELAQRKADKYADKLVEYERKLKDLFLSLQDMWSTLDWDEVDYTETNLRESAAHAYRSALDDYKTILSRVNVTLENYVEKTPEFRQEIIHIFNLYENDLKKHLKKANELLSRYKYSVLDF